MNKITDAIAIMDEKGRQIGPGGGTIGLWKKDWDWLRALLLTIKLRTEREGARIEELRKRSIYQQVGSEIPSSSIADKGIERRIDNG